MDKVNRDQKAGRQHDYSYVDVLERVADGVHVDIVARKDERPPEKSRTNPTTNPSEASERPASSKR